MNQSQRINLAVELLKELGMPSLARWVKGNAALGKSIGEIQSMLDKARNVLESVSDDTWRKK